MSKGIAEPYGAIQEAGQKGSRSGRKEGDHRRQMRSLSLSM